MPGPIPLLHLLTPTNTQIPLLGIADSLVVYWSHGISIPRIKGSLGGGQVGDSSVVIFKHEQRRAKFQIRKSWCFSLFMVLILLLRRIFRVNRDQE